MDMILLPQTDDFKDWCIKFYQCRLISEKNKKAIKFLKQQLLLWQN